MFQILNTFFLKKHSAVLSVLWLGLLWLSSAKANEIQSPAFLSLDTKEISFRYELATLKQNSSLLNFNYILKTLEKRHLSEPRISELRISEPKPFGSSSLDTRKLMTVWAETLIQTLDPQKVYFTQQQVDQLARAFETLSFDDPALYIKLEHVIDLFHRQQKATYEATRDWLASGDISEKTFDGVTDASQIRSLLQSSTSFISDEKTRLNTYKANVLDQIKYRLLNGDEYHREKLSDILNELLKNYQFRASDQHLYRWKSEDKLTVIVNSLLTVLHGEDDNNETMSYSSRLRFDEMSLDDFEPRFGIGVVIEGSPDHLVINKVLKGGTAWKTQLLPGDELISIRIFDNDKNEFQSPINLQGLDANQAKQHITGSMGVPIKLKIRRGARIFDEVFDRWDIPAVDNKVRLKALPIGDSSTSTRLAHISVPDFYHRGGRYNTGYELNEALKKIKHSEQGYQGVLLDLRGNHNGDLEVASAIQGLFVGANDAFYIESAGQAPLSLKSHDQGVLYHEGAFKNLVVLVDQFTAGAAEVLASNLQTLGRAKVIGTITQASDIYYGYDSVNSGDFFPRTGNLVFQSGHYQPAAKGVDNQKRTLPVNPDISTDTCIKPSLINAKEQIKPKGDVQSFAASVYGLYGKQHAAFSECQTKQLNRATNYLTQHAQTSAIQEPINQQFEQMGLDMLLSERGFYEGGEPSAVVNELDELLTIQLNWVEQYPQCRDVALNNLARLEVSGLYDLPQNIPTALYDRLVHHWHQLLAPVQFKTTQSNITEWKALKTSFQRLNSSYSNTQAELVDRSIQARPETASDSFICE